MYADESSTKCGRSGRLDTAIPARTTKGMAISTENTLLHAYAALKHAGVLRKL